MPGFSNRGMKMVLDTFFRAATAPTNFYVALVTSAAAPTADTNVLSDLTEIAAGNGYTTGGYQLARNITDFDFLNEDDINDRLVLQIKDVPWVAAGGPIPSSGAGARYAVLTDDNVTVGSRQVIFWWDLGADRAVTIGQTLTLQNLELRGTTPVGITNRGMKRVFDGYFRAQSVPTTFYAPLITEAAAPTVDTNTFSELTEIATGNGYTAGGNAVARNNTDFDVLNENDINDRAELQLKDQVWTAAVGSLPASGTGARYMLLTDDNGTPANRDVLVWWDLVAARTVTVGNSLTIQNAELRGLN